MLKNKQSEYFAVCVYKLWREAGKRMHVLAAIAYNLQKFMKIKSIKNQGAVILKVVVHQSPC